jgi:hypothetical protein
MRSETIGQIFQGRHASGALFALALVSSYGCSGSAEKACDKLSWNDQREATVKTFALAADALRKGVSDVENRFYSLCNAMNRELKLDATKTSTVEVCAVLHDRVRAAVAQGAQVSSEVAPNCVLDVALQANCESRCETPGNCDLASECLDGGVVVACNGPCSGACDSVASDAGACNGTCHGDCSTPTSSPVCTGQLGCPEAQECHLACQALATGSIDCSRAALNLTIVGDPELESVIQAHAEEWANLVALTHAREDTALSFGAHTIDAIGAGNYIKNSEQACFVDALGTTVVTVTSTQATIQASESLDPTVDLPLL